MLEEILPTLDSSYEGKYIAITKDGRVVLSADSDIELLERIEESEFEGSELFMRRVDLRPAYSLT
jgi:hypothetical protein